MSTLDERIATKAEPMDAESFNANGLAWAVSRWNDEVKNRPLVNVHRRSLDDSWRQVIRYFGGDPVKLIGPSHDTLHMQAQEARAWKPPIGAAVPDGSRDALDSTRGVPR